MKVLYGYLKQFRWLVFLALGLASINQLFSLIDPLIFQHIIDKFLMKKSEFTSSSFVNHILFWVGMGMCAAMVSRIAKNFQDYFTNVITLKVGAQIYSDGLKHSLELPYSVFEDQRSGETLGKLQKVRSDVEKLIQAFIGILFTTLVGVVFVFVYSIRIYWLIAPVYFAMVPILGIISSFMSRKIKQIQKKIVAETTALAGSTTESLRNIELVKSLGLSSQEIERLNATTVKILGLELKKVRFIRSLSFIQGTIVNLIRNVLLTMFTILIFYDKLSVGQMFTLQIYSFFIFGPLQDLGNIINTYRETEVSLNNFEAIMNTPKDPKPAKPANIKTIDTLTFNDVSFKHQSSSGYAIENISFETQTGKTIAFAGPSGSGKTTLVKLLVGLYQPAKGEILYNGNSSHNVDLDKLREQMGLVTQDAQLFSGTIKENLLFVAPNASDADCMDVLHKAACENLLARADKGIDTVIGEGGVKVSGGEKQRLSIARALLRKPTLLVFDEATSALDSLTEEEISTTIRNVSQSQNHITILIAHRLSTIMHADTIFVLEKGHIVESGRHEDLLAQKGLYYAMWRQQVGERKTTEPKLKVLA
jgi:ATP-binding cassette subfamily B protein